MKYQIEKPCHLGQKGDVIELSERAAAHLLAAGLIAPVKSGRTVEKKKRN